MNKLSKILAVVLLLSVVLSAFGIFASFADEAAPAEWEQYVKTLFDSDTSSISMSSVGGNYPNYPTLASSTEAGQKIWTLSMGDAKVGATGNNQDFFNTMTTTYSVRFRDNTSTTSSIAGAKNTDYIIFDLDVATDTEFIDDIYLNLRLLTSKSTSYKTNIVNNAYPAIGRASDGSLYVSTHKGANVLYARDVIGKPVDNDYIPDGTAEKKWTNVTFVYDFHPYTVTDEETGEQTTAISNNCYVYFDGIFAGNIACFGATATSLYFARLQTLNNDVVKTANSSTQFTNFTIKTISSGYNGILNTAGTLGSDVNLADIPELAYCLEDCISGTTESGYKTKLADIQRGEEIIPVYNADDLHGDLQDGDVVTAYVNLNGYRSFYAVKMVSQTRTETQTTTVVDEETGEETTVTEEITVTEDVAANITWLDENGAALGTKIAMPNIVNVPSGATWVAFTHAGAIKAVGDETTSYYGTYKSGTKTYYVVHDELYDARYNKIGVNGEILLFADYASVGAGSSTDLASLESLAPDSYAAYMAAGGEAPTKSGANINRIGADDDLVMDLNGYTFTNLAVYQHHEVLYGGTLVIKNGNLVHGAGVMNMVMHSAGNDTTLLCKNLNISDLGSSTFADHRFGYSYYKNCTIDLNVSLDNIKAVGARNTYLYVNDCTVIGKGQIAHMSQVSADGGRQGGGNIHIGIGNSDITSTTAVLTTATYANQSTTAGDAYTNNIINYYVDITGSKITTPSVALEIIVSGVPKAGENKLQLFTDFNIKNSEIIAKAVLSQAGATADDSLVTLNTDMKVEGSKFAVEALVGLGNNAKVNVVNIDLPMGTLLASKKYGTTSVLPNVTLPEGAQILGTSTNGDYSFIVATEYDTYTYQLGTEAPVEFLWSKGEGEQPDPSKIVATAANDIYSYSWAQNGNAFTTVLNKVFTVNAKSNLTLAEDFRFNLYISAEEYAAYGQYLTVKDKLGNILTGETVEIDGASYVKYSAKNVSATQAEANAMIVEIAFNGAYGDSYAGDSLGFTVLDYAKNVIAGGDAEEIAFIDAILNYIASAYAYTGKNNENVTALISEGAEFATEIEGEAKLESAAGIEVALNYGTDLNWAIKATEAATVTVEYTAEGNPVSVTKELAAGESFMIAFKAYDMINSIKVNGAELNLKGYCDALADESAKAMVIAIYNYVKAAAEYKLAH